LCRFRTARSKVECGWKCYFHDRELHLGSECTTSLAEGDLVSVETYENKRSLKWSYRHSRLK